MKGTTKTKTKTTPTRAARRRNGIFGVENSPGLVDLVAMLTTTNALLLDKIQRRQELAKRTLLDSVCALMPNALEQAMPDIMEVIGTKIRDALVEQSGCKTKDVGNVANLHQNYPSDADVQTQEQLVDYEDSDEMGGLSSEDDEDDDEVDAYSTYMTYNNLLSNFNNKHKVGTGEAARDEQDNSDIDYYMRDMYSGNEGGVSEVERWLPPYTNESIAVSERGVSPFVDDILAIASSDNEDEDEEDEDEDEDEDVEESEEEHENLSHAANHTAKTTPHSSSRFVVDFVPETDDEDIEAYGRDMYDAGKKEKTPAPFVPFDTYTSSVQAYPFDSYTTPVKPHKAESKSKVDKRKSKKKKKQKKQKKQKKKSKKETQQTGLLV
jgi:chemotaxis protein histidine kinase CheA